MLALVHLFPIKESCVYESVENGPIEEIQGSSFGAWLKEHRKAHDLTQEELADRVGCSRDHIRKMELGQRRPSRQVAELLGGDLGVPAVQWPAFVRWARTEGMRDPRISAPPLQL